MRVATVSQAAPLRVRLDSASQDSAATLVRGSTYSPAADDRVLIEVIGRAVYVVGGA